LTENEEAWLETEVEATLGFTIWRGGGELVVSGTYGAFDVLK
jgi:hypothetical protein